MINIQRYYQQQTGPAVGGRTVLDPRARSAEFAGIDRLAGDAADLATRYEKIQQERDTVDVLSAYDAFADEERSFLQEQLNLKGKNARTAIAAGAEWYGKTSGRYASEILTNDGQRQEFNRLISRRRESGLNTLARHAAQEHRADIDDTLRGALATAEEDIRMHPGRSDDAVSTFRTMLSTLRSGQDTTADAIAAERQLRTAAVQAMMHDQPAAALEYIEKHKEALGGVYGQLKNQITTIRDRGKETDAYYILKDQYGDDYDSALDTVRKPGFMKRHGLTLDNADAVALTLKAERKEQADRKDAADKEQREKETDIIFKAIRQKDYKTAIDALESAEAIDEMIKYDIEQAITEAQPEPADVIWGRILEGIRKKDIRHKSQLLPALARGITPEQYNKAVSLIKTVSEQSDPGYFRALDYLKSQIMPKKAWDVGESDEEHDRYYRAVVALDEIAAAAEKAGKPITGNAFIAAARDLAPSYMNTQAELIRKKVSKFSTGTSIELPPALIKLSGGDAESLYRGVKTVDEAYRKLAVKLLDDARPQRLVNKDTIAAAIARIKEYEAARQSGGAP